MFGYEAVVRMSLVFWLLLGGGLGTVAQRGHRDLFICSERRTGLACF